MNTKPDCYTKQPTRPEKEHVFSVCQCGHYWHRHDSGSILSIVLGVFLFFFTLGHYGGNCEECECNRYHFMGRYTYGERNALQPCEDTKDID